ncbi:response regulator receiver protein [Niastella koreensis GR20-10]|uniref:Response regulator receiver protein n=1 Tax=Niastella koreensis (strain DSM 17620 / KACC 11465 / NBRC 106392 / GR20-10) TaxID=700598 RepID=G8T7A0_NIAKG|nr:response regulator [Niastella koreensis]AEW00125.1 response regulator receiver protein [Niastella koreensis GR20-10]
MKRKILLVEDNPEMLEVITDELSEHYQVQAARDGIQAIKVLKNESVDLVITDIMMPFMDGFELCKTIKSDVEFSHVPVILLTAKNTLQSKIEGLGLGADAYIEKPFDPELLLAQIANLLDNRRKLKQHFAHSPIAKLNSMAYTHSDEFFLEKLDATIQNNIDDTDLDVDKLARLMNLGRTSLFRKIKSLTDLTPNELVNITRLKKAAELLASDDLLIYEVSVMVGYRSQTNFGRNFFKTVRHESQRLSKEQTRGEG